MVHRSALDAFAKGLKLTMVHEGRIAQQTRPTPKRRQTENQDPDLVRYAVEGQMAARIDIHARQLRQKSCFIVATNDTDGTVLSDGQVLDAYRKDQQKVERGFRFLKDPQFMAATLFLKSVKRVMTLTVIMTLCLLVYAVLEYRIRKALREAKETFPNQLGQPVANPTAR